MLNQVSWSEYFSVLITLVVIYYALVLVIFYRHDIQQLLSGRSPQLAGPATKHSPLNAPDNGHLPVKPSGNNEEEKQYNDAARLMQELSPLFNKNYVKEELVKALQLKLGEYTAIKGTPFQEAVNKYIATEGEKCSIHLSESDMRVIWTR